MTRLLMHCLSLTSLLLCCYYADGQKYLLLDTRLAKTAITANTFSNSDIFKHKFPVFRDDVQEITAEAIVVAKSLERQRSPDEYRDTFPAGHSQFIAKAERLDGRLVFTVVLKTFLGDMNVMMDIIEKLDDRRRAEMGLLNFANYLRPN